MKEQLISSKTAKLAKEKGYFDMFGKNTIEVLNRIEEVKHWGRFVPIPTQSLLQKWLREKHKICISIYQRNVKYRSQNWGWDIKTPRDFIQQNINDVMRSVDENLTYEQALEKGLQEALELLKL